ncbi:MAG: hypothetical protein ACR2N0_01890 [Rubrobacteraceae bacterium]
MNVSTTVKWAIHAHYLTIFAVVILISVVLGIHLYLNEFDRGILLAAGGGAFSFLYFVQKQQLEEAHLIKDLIVRFNAKYNELNGTLNEISDSTIRTQKIDDTLDDYFNLCGEEYLFYTRGFIYPEVWDSWVKGMEFFWKYKVVEGKWQEETTDEDDNKNFSQYYGFNPEDHFSKLYKQNPDKEHIHPN